MLHRAADEQDESAALGRMQPMDATGRMPGLTGALKRAQVKAGDEGECGVAKSYAAASLRKPNAEMRSSQRSDLGWWLWRGGHTRSLPEHGR